MQVKHTNIEQATRGARVLDRGLRTAPASLNTVCVSALRYLKGFWLSDLLEHMVQKLAQTCVRDADSHFASD